MNDDTTGKISDLEPRTDWDRLRRMTDVDVHAAVVADPDIKPTDEEFWKSARLVEPQRTQIHSNQPAAKASSSDQRFRRAVKRLTYDAFWLYTYQTAIKRLRTVEATGLDFFRVSLYALQEASLVRLVRIFETSPRVASIWYLQRCNQDIFNNAISCTHLEIDELHDISQKLRGIRNRTFVHIDKEAVFDPQSSYRQAGLKEERITLICVELWQAMKIAYRLAHDEEFKHDVYNAEDIVTLALFRDQNERTSLI